MESSIIQNIEFTNQRISKACIKSGRNPNDVKLLLASKTVSAENIKLAFLQGQTLIGENKVQELKEKYDALCEISHITHFIGHLQSNKIKEVLKYTQCIQSVDRIDLVQKLDQQLQLEGRQQEIMLQINTSAESSKFGANPSEAIAFAKVVSQYDTLKVTGLMTIGIFKAPEQEIRKCFKLLRNIQLEINALDLPNFNLKELSMGMSNDLEIAIEEGATIVRVGTAIFGTRIYPNSYYWNEKIITK